MKKLMLTCWLLLGTLSIISCHRELEVVREWKQLDFAFPNSRIRSEAIQKGLFVPENTFPIDVDVDYHLSLDLDKSRVFVTVPRFTQGIPVTLGFLKQGKEKLRIQPYPDYSWHSSHGDDCNGITSVLRVAIDSCHQLYVLDTGLIGENRICPPQLLVFNLRNDQLIRRYKFPSSQYSDKSLFIAPILDVKDPAPNGKCSNVKVYIADVSGFALIVYDAVSNKSWKIQNKLFYPYPNYGTFTISGETFDLMDGLFGLSLSPKKSRDDSTNAVTGSFNRQTDRALYFHSLASGHENYVPLHIINNASIWETDANAQPRAFKVLGQRGGQTAAEAMDSNGNLFFVMFDPIAIACWDSSLPYAAENMRVVLQNDVTLQFASGLKIVKNLFDKEELWVLTNRFQKIATGTLNPNEINFRVQLLAISELLGGKQKCNGNVLDGIIRFPPTA